MEKSNMKGNIIFVYFSEVMLFLGTVAETVSGTTISPTQMLVKSSYCQKGINPYMVNTFSSLNGKQVLYILKQRCWIFLCISRIDTGVGTGG